MPLSPGLRQGMSDDDSISISEEEIKKDAELDKKFNRNRKPKNDQPEVDE